MANPVSSAAASTEVFLRLGHSLESLTPTLHNGPGWRIGIWVQGCSLLCTRKCLNPHLLPAKGGNLVTVEAVTSVIAGIAARADVLVEGVTILGGEPTDQAEAVAQLLEAVRAQGLSTMLYSGHTLNSLRRAADPLVARLLRSTDVLVDGPFRDRFYDDTLAWRGSANQRLHCLTARYAPADLDSAFALQAKSFSIVVAPNGRISVSGLQTRDGAAAIERLVTAPNDQHEILTRSADNG